MNRKQRGIMLVELMIGMLVAAGVVMILGLVVSRLFAMNLQAKEHQQFLANLGRLSQQFRRDVHAAAAASVQSKSNESQPSPTEYLSLSVGPRTVIYSIAASGVERAISEGGAGVAREVFSLPGFQPLSLSFDEHRQEVALTVGRLAHSTDAGAEVSGRFSILAMMRKQADAQVQQP